jgi:hypothetical protein
MLNRQTFDVVALSVWSAVRFTKRMKKSVFCFSQRLGKFDNLLESNPLPYNVFYRPSFDAMKIGILSDLRKI